MAALIRWDFCPTAPPQPSNCPDDLGEALAGGLKDCSDSCTCNCLKWMISERFQYVGQTPPAEITNGTCSITLSELAAILNSVRSHYHSSPGPAMGTVDSILEVLRGNWFVRRPVMDVEQSMVVPRGIPVTNLGTWSVPRFDNCEVLSGWILTNQSTTGVDLHFSPLEISADWYGSDDPRRTFISCFDNIRVLRESQNKSTTVRIPLAIPPGRRFFLARVTQDMIPVSDDQPFVVSPPSPEIERPPGMDLPDVVRGVVLPVDYRGSTLRDSLFKEGQALGPGGPETLKLQGCSLGGGLERLPQQVIPNQDPELQTGGALPITTSMGGLGIDLSPRTSAFINGRPLPWLGPVVMDVTPMLQAGNNVFEFNGDHSDAFLIEGFYSTQVAPVIKYANRCWRYVGRKDWTRSYPKNPTVKFQLSALVRCRFLITCA